MTRVAAPLCAALLLSGCSLMGLDEYDQIACDPDETDGTPECNDLNAQLPEGSCGRFYCHPSGKGCYFAERIEPETCDGLDNNCNGYIDEGAEFLSDERSFDEANVASVSVAASTEGTIHLLLTRSPGISVVTRRTVSGSVIGPSEPAFDDSKCTAPPAQGAADCNIEHVTLAAGPDVIVAAGIHTTSCFDGQLRLGAASPSESLPMGDDPERRASFGIDVEPAGMLACSHSTDCDGAADPALSLGPAEGPQASEGLLVWRAPTRAEACDQFRLAGLGFAVEPGEGDFSRLRVHETSVPLSEAAVDGPAAIAALSSIGYAVAFPSEDEVVLLLVSPLGDLESVRVLDEARLGAAQASEVALVSGDVERPSLGVAYRSKISEGDVIVFETMAVDEGRFERLGPQRALSTAGKIAAGPALAYSARGFHTAISDEPEGGFWVFWVEQARDAREGNHTLLAARIAEHGHQVLNDRIDLTSGSIHQVFTHPKHVAGDAEPAFGFLTDRAVHLGSVSCEN